MGEVRCDILTGDDMCCVFVRYVDTTSEKITSFRAPSRFDSETLKQCVTHVMFYRGTLPKFPREISEFFPSVKFIDIFDCGMGSIYKEDLEDFKNLERLKLETNLVSYLPGDLFDASPKITHFSFAENKITKIGENLLKNLENLVEVNFKKNPGIDYHYKRDEEGSFEELDDIIRNNCKPIESLQEMAVKTLQDSLSNENADYTLVVAEVLKIDELKERVEKFLKICEY